MTQEETTKFLAIVKVAYPVAYRDMDDVMKKATVRMWANDFSTIPYPIMCMAFDRFKKINKYPPTVAEMFEELRGLYAFAVGESLMATARGDKKMIQQCEYIIDHTSQFRGGGVGGLEYNCGYITDNLLAGGNEGKDLIEG